MAIVNQHIQSNTFSTALTVPAGKTYAITNILVCNNGDAGSANFDMHFVPQGDPISNTDTRVINNCIRYRRLFKIQRRSGSYISRRTSFVNKSR